MTHFRELTDRYTLEKILRSTRGGTVLRGVDHRTGQAVAVKLITVTSPPLLVQKAPELEKLGALLEALREPSLPVVTDSGFTTDGSAFLVMELLEGKTLDALSGPPQRLLGLLIQALDGLEALARRGVAHQNLSPDNLLVVGEPPAERIKILGLGGALFRTPGAASAETARFRAPEENAPGPIDWRADMASFALTACYVMGITVAPGEPASVQMPFALSLDLENAEALRHILERCLRRNPAERPSPPEVRDALRRALGAQPAPPPEPAPKPEVPKLVVPPAPAPPPQAAQQPAPPRPAAPVTPPAPVQPAAPARAIPPLRSIPLPGPLPEDPPAPRPPAAAPPPQAPPGRPLSGAVLLSSLAAASSPPPASPPAPSPSPSQVVSTPPAAAPPAPEPPPDGELLPALDDDFLNALSGPPAAAPAGAAPMPPPRTIPMRSVGSASAATPPPKPNPVLKPGVLIAVAAVLVLGAAGAFWWLSRSSPAAEAPKAAVPVLPAAPPPKPAAEILAEAQSAMADGDWSLALDKLDALNGADQATLTPAACRSLTATQAVILGYGADHLSENLAQGLKKGDLGKLRFALRSAAAQGEASLPEAVRQDLARGQSLIDLYAGIEDASNRKADLEVLEKFSALEKDLPGASDPDGLRPKAATSLEAQAEGLAREGKYEEAMAKLDQVLRNWPQRDVARDRAKIYVDARQRTSQQEALLEALPAAERKRKPHEGLEMLRGVEPVPHLAAQFADIRKRLEEQLDTLDQQPPKVLLRDGYFLEYDRGQVVELSFRVTDDYMVQSVKLMVRPEGGRTREVPLDKTTLGYTAEIPPDVHRNGNVDVWVVATDASGHEGFYGTPSAPMRMVRRKGFDRLVN